MHAFASKQFCVDSQLLNPGDIFVALPGEKTDGHKFLKQAAEKHAAAAIVQNDYSGADFGLQLVQVPDTLKALQNFAKETLQKNRKKVVGITGTVGKTTCKDFIVTLLSGKYRVAYTQKSQNSKISLPLTILNQSGRGEDVLVLEMGMSASGEIARLTDIAPPDIAVITAISLVHAENFDSLDEIERAKGEILSHPKTAWGVIPKQNKILSEIGTCKKQTFSGEEWDSGEFCLPRHHMNNVAAAAAVCRLLNLSRDEICSRFPLLKLPEGRGNHILKNGILFIDDAYNASPLSVKAALEALPEAQGKRIGVLGDMRELGKFSGQAHREIGSMACKKLDRLICFGSECAAMAAAWQGEKKHVSLHSEKHEIVTQLKEVLEPGDIVLLKGSHSCSLWEILEEF